MWLSFRNTLCKLKLGTDIKDPFLFQCKCPDNLANLNDWKEITEISALELAFRRFKPERAIAILEVTGGIHSYLLYYCH